VKLMTEVAEECWHKSGDVPMLDVDMELIHLEKTLEHHHLGRISTSTADRHREVLIEGCAMTVGFFLRQKVGSGRSGWRLLPRSLTISHTLPGFGYYAVQTFSTTPQIRALDLLLTFHLSCT
jgi:hypothetical protein